MVLRLEGDKRALEARQQKIQSAPLIPSRAVQSHTTHVVGQFLHLVVHLRFGRLSLASANLKHERVDRVAAKPNSECRVGHGRSTACNEHRIQRWRR